MRIFRVRIIQQENICPSVLVHSKGNTANSIVWLLGPSGFEMTLAVKFSFVFSFWHSEKRVSICLICGTYDVQNQKY